MYCLKFRKTLRQSLVTLESSSNDRDKDLLLTMYE